MLGERARQEQGSARACGGTGADCDGWRTPVEYAPCFDVASVGVEVAGVDMELGDDVQSFPRDDAAFKLACMGRSTLAATAEANNGRVIQSTRPQLGLSNSSNTLGSALWSMPLRTPKVCT